MFLAPDIFLVERPLNFLTLSGDSMQPDSDHVTTFHGDRPRDLEMRLPKKERKKTSRVKHKPVRNYRSGRPNKKQ